MRRCASRARLPRFCSWSRTPIPPAHQARDVWHCHISRAFYARSVALPQTPCVLRPAYARCVALPHIPCVLREKRGTATVPVQREGEPWHCHDSPARSASDAETRRLSFCLTPCCGSHPSRCSRHASRGTRQDRARRPRRRCRTGGRPGGSPGTPRSARG